MRVLLVVLSMLPLVGNACTPADMISIAKDFVKLYKVHHPSVKTEISKTSVVREGTLFESVLYLAGDERSAHQIVVINAKMENKKCVPVKPFYVAEMVDLD